MNRIQNMAKMYPLAETRSTCMECLAKYKTIAAKKAFMTREMKAHVNFLKEVTEAVTREYHRGWYLGDYYTAAHVLHYAKELVVLQEIKSSLG